MCRHASNNFEYSCAKSHRVVDTLLLLFSHGTLGAHGERRLTVTDADTSLRVADPRANPANHPLLFRNRWKKRPLSAIRKLFAGNKDTSDFTGRRHRILSNFKLFL